MNVAGTRVECKESIVSLGVSIDSGLTCNRRVKDIIQLPSAGTETHPTGSQHEDSFGSWKSYRSFLPRLLQRLAIWDI